MHPDKILNYLLKVGNSYYNSSEFQVDKLLYKEKLDEDFTQEELKALFPTARSFPIIVINGNYIGGYSELKQKLSST